MNYKLNSKFKIIGKLVSANKGNLYSNINLSDKDGQVFNVKIEEDIKEELLIGRVYEIEVIVLEKKQVDKKYLKALTVEDITYFKDKELMYKYYSNFYKKAPVDIFKLQKNIETSIEKMKNEKLKQIVLTIYNKYKDKFYTHPAGTKMHHAYIGGLAYHTATMLDIAKRLLKVYSYLNSDLLVAGVLLHDIEKVNEMTGVDGEYSKEGLLIGHLCMGCTTIDKTAEKLGYNTEDDEILCLKHLLLSHHGIPNFGSPKRPQTPEALLLWYIDSIDSKLCIIGEELKNTNEGEFTQPIIAADRLRMYKHKIK